MGPERPPERDLVLVGGGHTHALVLRQLAMRPPSELRITLISPAPFTPYSGMLPGLLAGHYGFEETHIDLARLCQWAGVRFLVDTVEGIDPQRQLLSCRARGELGYDLVSLDIGSQPELDSVPGAREHAVPVKPIARLWERWQALAERPVAGMRIAVVGGGAGSVEIALAIAQRFRAAPPSLTLYCAGQQLLSGYHQRSRQAVEQQLQKLGVQLACGRRVTRVEAQQMHFHSGGPVPFDTLIWCTGAAPADWIARSALATDERGFLRVEDTLQSVGYANVFAAGDIATQYRNPRPKAGVYAVRQAPVLAHNLVAQARGERLREHHPQRHFLSLLSLGTRQAVAQRHGLSARGAWIWRWKDHIDRRFMQRFSQLLERPMAPGHAAGALPQAPCGGCGAKVGARTLSAVLEELAQRYPKHTPVSLDDAALIDTRQPLLQSLDVLRALVDDPWRMGRIAAQHALSDLYACGATPHSALAQITLPFAAAPLLERDLTMALEGALSVLSAADCRLIGGHSMQGPELQLGFAVSGVLDAGAPPLRTKGGQPGDSLLLCKPLGVGALFAAHMQARADGRHVQAALDEMERGNADAAKIARRCGANAVTDVTGFGLAGHLSAMLGDTLSAELELAALPVVEGALAAMRAGIFSTLQDDNRDALGDRLTLPEDAPVAAQLLFDPQTCGGLLMALPAAAAEEALQSLGEQGYRAALIGSLTACASRSRITLR